MRWRHVGIGALLVLPIAGLSCDGGGPIPNFDQDRAFADLEAQVDFGPRVPGTPEHLACRQYLVEQLVAAGGKVSVQTIHDPYFELEEVDSLYNIRARFGPEDGPHLILGAHWDSRPWADQDPDTSRRHEAVLGANDGASGVAVLLEIARVFGTIPPDIGVEIVLFDGEDAGRSEVQDSYCRGSQGYVRQMGHPHPTHVVIVDMVGRQGMELYRERNSDLAAKNLVDRIWKGAKRVEANSFVNEPRYFVYDDHVPFIQAGIPAVDLIDLDDPAWHTTSDDVAHCDAQSLGDVGRALLWHVYTLELDLP